MTTENPGETGETGPERDGHEPHPHDRHGHEEVGSLGEEALRLLGSLAGWAREHGADSAAGWHGLQDAVGHVADEWRQAGTPPSSGPAECSVCPVCRALRAVREVSPEVKDHLASAATHLLLAATAFRAAPPRGHAPDADGEQEPGPASAGGPRVERIDLDGDWPEADVGDGR